MFRPPAVTTRRRPIWRALLALLALVALWGMLLVLSSGPAEAQTTFTVNKTGDAKDRKITDAKCDSSRKKGKQCTLRAAIEEANDTLGPDLISFNIGGTIGVKTISPASPLPPITETVTIDGYTQRGASPNTLAVGNNAVLKIQLNGTNAGAAGADGLTINASDSIIRGLVINRFGGSGIRIDGSLATNNKVEGNFLGTDPSGAIDLGNGFGVRASTGASNNTIGGTDPAKRNVISGNGIGALIGSGATGNLVQGNYIGTDKNGTADLGNGSPGFGSAGVQIGAANNTVGGTTSGAGNVISGNVIGVEIVSGSNNEVQGNFIGTKADGNEALGNGLGVWISSSDNTIGGTASEARNVISGNDFDGVEILAITATGNEVQGNYIGTDKNGTADLGNGSNGVSVTFSPGNTIGGTDADDGAVDGVVKARNIISGNNQHGVSISGVFATGNKIEGNFIGTTVSGNEALGNLNGVVITDAPNNTIGGTDPAQRNVISGNSNGGNIFSSDGNGVVLAGPGTTGNQVLGNFIGTNASGTQDLGNDNKGVSISAANNTIGGTVSGARNVISGNNGASGIFIVGDSATGNEVQGNFIGTKAGGNEALGNRNGVLIESASTNTIGGAASGARNVISGNSEDGVLIFSGTSGGTNNKVEGNFIGTTAAGSGALGNGSNGVAIRFTASNNTIGGATGAEGNRIAHNGGDGVLINPGIGNSMAGNRVLSNQIFHNGQLGIDLGDNGVTNNDTDDPDTGANNLQNFPDITSAIMNSTTGSTTISGTINSNPNQTYTIQCFVTDEAADTAHGEGAALVSATTATTNSGGDGNFVCPPTLDVGIGQTVTATATNTATGDTSEFSRNVAVIQEGPPL